MERVRVLIADDQPIYRRGVAQLLSESEGVGEVIEMCPVTLLNKVEALNEVSADVLIYGNMSRGLTSLIVPWVVMKQQPNIKIIIIGSAADAGELLDALRLGIAAYVPRCTASDEMAELVKNVAKGNSPIFDEVLERPELAVHVLDLYRNMIGMEEAEEAPRAASVNLSRREVEVLEYAADGLSNKQIGATMSLSERTVRNHMSSLLSKLGAHNRVEAVIKAIRKGIIMEELVSERAIQVPEVPEVNTYSPADGETQQSPARNVPPIQPWPFMNDNHLYGPA